MRKLQKIQIHRTRRYVSNLIILLPKRETPTFVDRESDVSVDHLRQSLVTYFLNTYFCFNVAGHSSIEP